jgi:hypothetical protein
MLSLVLRRHPPPTWISFSKALGDDWLTKMSGPLSVPFAVLALVFKDRLAGILFGALAFVCLVVASYAVWRRERIAVRVLEREVTEERERTKPRVELVFDKDCGACQNIVHAGVGTEVRLSIGVRNCGSQSLHDVRVFIVRGLVPGAIGGFSHLVPSGATHTEHLRLLSTGSGGMIVHVVDGPVAVTAGRYTGRLQVQAEHMVPAECDFEIVAAHATPIVRLTAVNLSEETSL